MTKAGRYDIYASSPFPDGTVRSVTIAKYYDVSTKEFYTPYVPGGGAFGHKGLQSELGQIDIPVTQGFGWYVGDGQLISVEARAADDDVFQFSFTYNDGSYYTGEVIDGGQALKGIGYSVGVEFGHAFGYYSITKALGPTTDVSGRFYGDTYHDVATDQDYTPEGHGIGPDGSTGLGSELDTTDGPEGSQRFGQFGTFEARQSPRNFYGFQFQYTDDSHYGGQVVADASFGCHAGSIIKTSYGFYVITGSGAGTTAPVGEVLLNNYYDATSQTSAQGVSQLIGPTSVHGLGFEIGYVYNVPFGQGGALEAKLHDYTAFNFTFSYFDGDPDVADFAAHSFYSGTVSDGGTYGYHVGQQIRTDYGVYTIGSIATDHLTDPSGIVYVTDYHDAFSGISSVPNHDALDLPASYNGLGVEQDEVGGVLFGTGGLYEADTFPRTQYRFTFSYIDGARYDGYVSGGSYTVGQALATPYGAYSILSQQRTSLQSGAVIVQDYIDKSPASARWC